MNLDIHYDSRAPSTLTGPGAVHRLDPPLVAPGCNNASVYCVVSETSLLNFFDELEPARNSPSCNQRNVNKRVMYQHVYCSSVYLELEENSQTHCAEK